MIGDTEGEKADDVTVRRIVIFQARLMNRYLYFTWKVSLTSRICRIDAGMARTRLFDVAQKICTGGTVDDSRFLLLLQCLCRG